VLEKNEQKSHVKTQANKLRARLPDVTFYSVQYGSSSHTVLLIDSERLACQSDVKWAVKNRVWSFASWSLPLYTTFVWADPNIAAAVKEKVLDPGS